MGKATVYDDGASNAQKAAKDEETMSEPVFIFTSWGRAK